MVTLFHPTSKAKTLWLINVSTLDDLVEPLLTDVAAVAHLLLKYDTM